MAGVNKMRSSYMELCNMPGANIKKFKTMYILKLQIFLLKPQFLYGSHKWLTYGLQAISIKFKNILYSYFILV